MDQWANADEGMPWGAVATVVAVLGLLMVFLRIVFREVVEAEEGAK